MTPKYVITGTTYWLHISNLNLIQQFNVRDNVAAPLLLSGMKERIIQKGLRTLEKVGMTNRMFGYPRTLQKETAEVAFKIWQTVRILFRRRTNR